MTTTMQPITTDIAQAILAWCGVDDPTPADITSADVAASAAKGTIRHYRGLDSANAWKTATAYSLNDVVQPTHPNGQLYICTEAGTTADTEEGYYEPTWPTTSGATVTDGTVEWTEHVRPFETRYESLAVEMGVYLYSKRGVDGVNNFSENGVQQSYEAGSFPPSMLSRITPIAKTG